MPKEKGPIRRRGERSLQSLPPGKTISYVDLQKIARERRQAGKAGALTKGDEVLPPRNRKKYPVEENSGE